MTSAWVKVGTTCYSEKMMQVLNMKDLGKCLWCNAEQCFIGGRNSEIWPNISIFVGFYFFHSIDLCALSHMGLWLCSRWLSQSIYFCSFVQSSSKITIIGDCINIFYVKWWEKFSHGLGRDAVRYPVEINSLPVIYLLPGHRLTILSLYMYKYLILRALAVSG